MYVVIDVETSGLHSSYARVIEFAAARLDRRGRITARWATRINPGSPLPQIITNLTGITDEDLAAAPRFADVADQVADILTAGLLVGHNVAFDVRFLRKEFTRAGRRAPVTTLLAVDTLRGSYRTWPGRGKGGYRLGTLTEALGGDSRGWHGAEADVAMTAAVLTALRREQRLLRLLRHSLIATTPRMRRRQLRPQPQPQGR